MSFGVRQVGRSDRWLEYPAVGRSVGRARVDGFDQEKARAGDGLLCGAITQRGTPTNRRNAEIQKQQTSWRYKKRKQETRRDDRPDGSRIKAPDEVYVEQLSLVNNNGERPGDGLLCDAIAQRGTPTNR